jgi:WD40 repeat protein
MKSFASIEDCCQSPTAISLTTRNAELERENQFLQYSLKAIREHFHVNEALMRAIIGAEYHELSAPVAPSSSMSNLPSEILLLVASYLDTPSLGRILVTSRLFRAILSQDSLWSLRCLWKWGPRKHTRHCRDLTECWKKRFDRVELADLAMKQGRARPTDYSGHVGTVTCLQLLSGGRVISGSDDGSMLLWTRNRQADLKVPPPPALALDRLALALDRPVSEEKAGTGRFSSVPSGSYNIARRLYRPRHSKSSDLCKSRTFHGHGGPIWCLSYNEQTEHVYSGGYDETIKVWDLCTGNCLDTLRGHTGWVSSLALLPSDNVPVLASSSWDNTLRIWSLGQGGELVRTINAGQESGALLCISSQPRSSIVSVGCCSSQVQIWDVEAGVLMSALQGHTREVHACQIFDRCVVSGSGDCTVKIWDQISGMCVAKLHEHSGSVMTLQYDGDYRVISGSYDKSVKIWDTRNTSTSLATIGRQNDPIFCLQFDDCRLVTGSADYVMRVFDIY